MHLFPFAITAIISMIMITRSALAAEQDAFYILFGEPAVQRSVHVLLFACLLIVIAILSFLPLTHSEQITTYVPQIGPPRTRNTKFSSPPHRISQRN